MPAVSTKPVSRPKNAVSFAFERIADRATRATGSAGAFSVAALIIVVWAATGPFFHYSETWQLIINTGTTIVTFLMVFLIQKTQNKESMAMQIKLNELIASSKAASNRLVDIESLTEDELLLLHEHYARLAEETKRRRKLHHSHSLAGAVERADRKLADQRASEHPVGSQDVQDS
jgi:low affinity Fe/Cu permease